MATTEKYVLGTIASLMTSELNGLANNALAVSSSAYNNIQSGGGGDGYTLCELELFVTFGTSPAANTGVSVWFLARPDGTNFEDGSSSVTPTRSPDAVFGVRAVTTGQRIVRRVVLPSGVSSILVKNEATGQAFASGSNTLKILPVTAQGV